MIRMPTEKFAIQQRKTNFHISFIKNNDFNIFLRNFETVIHLLKCSLGTGILAMPQAFYNAGYLNGFISTVLIGMLCTYGVHILVRCQYILCKRHSVPMLTYQETLKKALEDGPHCLRNLAKAAP